jgi:four helix bundle protein
MRDHRRLKAFALADGLAIQVYRHTRTFPREETYGLVSQLRRAPVSVPTNIVEGCARRTEAEYLQFLNHAFGSLREVGYLFDLSHRLGFVPDDSHRQVTAEYNEAAQTLGALLRSCAKARQTT